jgi:dihydroflavonol-4-reductase
MYRGLTIVAEACLITGVGRLVYTSSIHALKEPPHDTAISESQPFDSLSVLGDYAKSKARASLIVKDAIRRGLDAVIVCPTGIIGPYDFKGSEMGQLVKSFVQRKLAAGVNGAYDFVDVRDVAAGLILAGEKGLKGETYILSGQQISVQDLFKNLEQISGVRAPRWFVPAWLARLAGIISTPFILSRKQKPLFTAYSIDVLKSNSRVDSQKARRLLGFTARPVYDSLRIPSTGSRRKLSGLLNLPG